MSKRTAEIDGDDVPMKGGDRPEPMDVDQDKEMGEFEDEFEDEFESEDEILEAGVDGRPDAEREAEERAAGAMDVDNGTFIVGRNKLEAGQHLAPDMGTYEMLHSLSTPWPCLSFDIVRDGLGDKREKVYPATMYTVAGTQAETGKEKENQLMVMKFSGLSRTQKFDDDEDSDSDDDAEDADPILESKSIPLASTTNRIRTHQIPSQDGSTPKTFTATMTESTGVVIHDITPHLESFDNPGTVITPQQNKPLSTIRAHKSEGYALDWSPLVPGGKLLTGDNDGLIYVTTRTDGGGWVTDTRAFQGHTSSVEEIQWSPQEASVFASASSDGTVRVWDVRSKSRKPAISITASRTDVNVMSWSHLTTHLLATGDDDGVWGVWDLRSWKAGGDKPSPIASFNYHKEQITSVEWHPTDDSMVAVAAGDNKVTLWDLSVELDDEESKDTAGVQDMPPQLLFEHIVEHAKEVHWHPQIPGTLVTTGSEFSVFRPIPVVYGVQVK
ncbi:WD40-repeat-containing domain protein [Pestalotiopsis sp. NC0098]|nr:WD40-repeat-containing domain protein [Pestalotiopsis sp. NC0098]